ncbi:hypothetical protein [Streptomyces sp. NPDC051079]|uniref:hypothetical protein n=1 Tax=Streptomyces sp. NPDC051079 TaxID=3155043 RepID=UPI00344B0D5F
MNEGAGGLSRLGTLVGAVAAPTSLVTALLYYFGYYHAYWFFAYFRVNSTVLGFSTADYLMRSLDVMWVPLTVLATLAVGAFWGYDTARRRLAARMGPVARRRATGALAVSGFLLTLGGLWSTFRETFLSDVLTLAPLSLSVGVTLLAYARHLVRRAAREPVPTAPPAPEAVPAPVPVPASAPAPLPVPAPTPEPVPVVPSPASPDTTAPQRAGPSPRQTSAPATEPPPQPAPRPEWATLAEWSVVFALVMLGVVWATNDYAASVGTVRAKRFAAGLSDYPSTVVYSAHSLAIGGPGVRETRCKAGRDAAPAYGYRYDGLVLILQSGNQYVLVPTRWTPADGVALVLPRNDSVRLEFGPPPGPRRGGTPAPGC